MFDLQEVHKCCHYQYKLSALHKYLKIIAYKYTGFGRLWRTLHKYHIQLLHTNKSVDLHSCHLEMFLKRNLLDKNMCDKRQFQTH